MNRQFQNPEYMFNPREFRKWTGALGTRSCKRWRARHNITYQDLLQELTHDCEATIALIVYAGRRLRNPCRYVKLRESLKLGACLFLRLFRKPWETSLSPVIWKDLNWHLTPTQLIMNQILSVGIWITDLSCTCPTILIRTSGSVCPLDSSTISASEKRDM